MPPNRSPQAAAAAMALRNAILRNVDLGRLRCLRRLFYFRNMIWQFVTSIAAAQSGPPSASVR
eukprot:3596890-Prymnesium_polylepis.1